MCSSQREWICPSRETWVYVWQINSLFWRKRREAPMEVRQLNYRRQSRAAEVLQNQGAFCADSCMGNCWRHLVGWEPLQQASEINDTLTSTSGASLCLQSSCSETSISWKTCRALLSRKNAPLDYRSRDNSCLSPVHSAHPLPPGLLPLVPMIGSFTSPLWAEGASTLVPRQVIGTMASDQQQYINEAVN